MNKDTPYSQDYDEARARFREAATALGARLEVYEIDAPIESHGEAVATEPRSQTSLTLDVAILAGSDPNRALVVSSGLHGVEGPFGSAIQLDWLRTAARPSGSPFSGTVVLIHAINPYGFHERRRVNENNVDLNRNFLLSDESYEGAPDAYPKLAPLLNPATMPGPFDLFLLRALGNAARYGYANLKQAVAAGQYEFPAGLFYGGTQPELSTRLLQQHFTSWVGDAERLIHIDLHSGLGSYARCQLLLVEPPNSPHLDWYRRHFGPNCEPLQKSGGTAYATRGAMGNWLSHHIRDRIYRFAVAEFGTYSAFRVLGALRAENRIHHYLRDHPASPDAAECETRERAKKELLECFCPASSRWRQLVLQTGRELIAAAARAD